VVRHRQRELAAARQDRRQQAVQAVRASRNTVPGGGSSSVFSSAFEAGMLSASAGYSTTTRRPWRWVEMFMKSASARICSILMSFEGVLVDLPFLSPSRFLLGFRGSSSSASGRTRR
jgi:hypothetical protein